MRKIINTIYYRLFKQYKNLYIKNFKKKSINKNGKKAELAKELIVSFTTIPSRIIYLPNMIKSILNQTVLPNRFILYVCKDEFANIDIKNILAEEIHQGLEIVYVDENLRSHKKYFYAMKDNPDSIVITVDDDIIYSSKMIEKLVKTYKKYPNCISAIRCHKILVNEQNKLMPYNDWEYEYFGKKTPQMKQLFFTSGGGTLFPPTARTEEFFDVENIKSLSFLADDVWLNFLAVKNGIKVVKATWGKGTPITIDDNPEESLVYMNAMYGNNNDKCIANMVEHYQIDFTGVD